MTPPAISTNHKHMGRKREADTELTARFWAADLVRVRAVLRPKEKVAAFIREAVERETSRREGLAKKRQARKAHTPETPVRR